MWEHAATQENIEMLRARGVRVVSPDEGYLACGMTGAGRLAGVEAIARAVTDALGLRHDLDGETVLVTAGPTCEDLDPVRYLTNRSSGKMGYALADAAARRGARVVLVSGPTALDAPLGVERVAVRSTAEMHRAVLDHLAPATIVVMAAAVADYRPVAPQAQKIKRSGERLVLELEPTTDILADVVHEKAIRARAARAKGADGNNVDVKDNFIVVGFAAETDRVAEHAQQKLAAKSADMIVANDVTAEGAGFDHDTNVVTIFTRDGRQTPLPRLSKREVADRVFDRVLELRSTHPVISAPER
jgi:phosphopantothenoylcysteine decarboxylase/phosphopantothenate--cysteine ligase